MTARTSDHVPAIDPWWDLFMPALFGERVAVLDALAAGEASVPATRRGDLYAVGARAFYALGRPVEAERLLDRALRLGGPEADALATFLRPDGAAIAERRLAAGRPGARADAACDRAALRLLAGDVPGARDDVALAESACPGHAEARRWACFLKETPQPLRAVAAARDPRRARRAGPGPVAEALALLPNRRSGWVSTERYQRRVLGSPAAEGWAPPTTALGRLQDTGVSVYYFALDLEYARMPASHVLVGLELGADALRARVDEGREAIDAAWAFWAAVSAVDDEARGDGAQVLAALGTADARLAPVALEAVGWLQWNRPDRALLWDGYLAWLLHLSSGQGAGRARALAAARPADALAWRMAIETLRAEGAADEADRLLRAALAEPRLAGVAAELLEQPRPEPFRLVVGARLTPRRASPVGRRGADPRKV